MSPTDLPPINRRRALAALVVGVAAPSALAACVNGPGKQAAKQAPPPKASLTFTPANDAKDVLPTTPVKLEVKDGWLQHVALTNAEGKPVAGALNRDRTAFTVTEPLGYGASYTWTGSAVGGDGQALPIAAAFTTINPTKQVNGQFQLSDGQTVGVAAPIILQFDAAIDDEHKADVEKALTVTTAPPNEGSWAWLPDEVGGSRVHWRTKEYYQPGTKVHVDAKLYGVKFGDDSFGASDSTLDFEIGRRQVVKADATSHRIQVITDEGVTMDFPCSYGEADKPRNVTRSGIHVVSEKYADFYMTNQAAGYSNVHERWAVRISNNGEFIHANPASSGAQGNTNVTNGCINLSTGDAEQYFGTAMYGDPVEVTGTSIQLSYADGDIWDWAVDWNEWKSMSALSDQKPETSIPSSAPATPTDAPTLSGTPTTTTPTTSRSATTGG
ncbi:L,D-transpeptidase [Mycolicibacterium pallens]|uniref:L,D-transpeptidase family protein n=1 Tax=Mycolicibacterium pallens TaxID=370524 RepID=A0ABX8VIQ3_9MYCO|nr:Ig-like domain-containing protein [Mycolicibacterium pallens]APE16865.1 L,D-transpeptidase [Mycobacterium sp. WY10]QYL17666.1 L,D-transpeptidase family protein [Mycolicibacterium pallens]